MEYWLKNFQIKTQFHKLSSLSVNKRAQIVEVNKTHGAFRKQNGLGEKHLHSNSGRNPEGGGDISEHMLIDR